MKQCWKFRIIFLTFLTLISLHANANTEIKVVRVYDGDSILARIEDNIFRIRLIGIDCFEGTEGIRAKTQARKFKLTEDEVIEKGNLAGEILKKELENKKVYFEFKGIDKYNRALGIIRVNNENINEKMLKTGYCSVY